MTKKKTTAAEEKTLTPAAKKKVKAKLTAVKKKIVKKGKEPIGPEAALKEVGKLLNAYDSFFWEEAAFNPDTMTDEDIESIIASEEDMGTMLNTLILAQKVYWSRKLRAEKNAKFCTKLMAKIMKTLDEKEWESSDGKAKFVPAWKFDADMAKLPEEFKMVCFAKVVAALNKNEKVKGVSNPEGYGYVRVY